MRSAASSSSAAAGRTHLGEVDDIGGEGSADKAVRLRGVVQEAGLQGDEPLRAQLDGLHNFPLLPVPKRQRVAVRCGHVCRIEALPQHKQRVWATDVASDADISR